MPRLRFTLRTLLVAVTFAGCLMGWAAYQLNWIRERREALSHNWHTSPRYGLGFTFSGNVDAPLTLRVFGEVGAKRIYLPDDTADEEIERIRRLFPECRVVLPAEPAAQDGLP